MGKCLFLRKGETHTAPISGILASDLAVGSSVYLMENGSAVEYLVVHQGLPSSMYNASCNGTWLLRKDIYSEQVWSVYSGNGFNTASIRSYLSNSILPLFSSEIQSIIKNVKIPYCTGGSYGYEIKSGSWGYDCKIFLLSGYEIGFTTGMNSSTPVDGSKLSYFIVGNTTNAISKRIAYLNGTAKNWWTRSPYTSNGLVTWSVSSGGSSTTNTSSGAMGVRPALILPSNALFDKNTLILKGVA